MRAAPEGSRGRRGVALVLALTLIILAGALVAGTSATARVAMRQAQARESNALAATRWRADVATFVTALDGAIDTLPVGAGIRGIIGPSAVGSSGEIAVTRLRLVRLDAHHCLLSAFTQLGPDSVVRARRRAALLLVIAPATDSTASKVAPFPPAQWAQNLLY
jgi:hypothetical protein